MMRSMLLLALSVTVAIVASSPATTRLKDRVRQISLQATLADIGLPSFHNPAISLSGLKSYLQRQGVTTEQFNRSLLKHRATVKDIILSLWTKHEGALADLVQLSALSYYGGESTVKNIRLSPLITGYITTTKTPSSADFNVRYITRFLNGFKGYVSKNAGQQSVVFPDPPPAPSYPGSELLATMRSIGLPTLTNKQASLGGVDAYLSSAGITMETFARRITLFGEDMNRLVMQHAEQYSGSRGDLLQVAALRYFGAGGSYSVQFSVAFEEALTPISEYTVSYVTSFIDRFGQYLSTPMYAGYSLRSRLVSAGLPVMSAPHICLPGLISYLQSNSYSRDTLVSRIQTQSSAIVATVNQYGAQYSGVRGDLLQLCVIRYYAMPAAAREEVTFGDTFPAYFRTVTLTQFNAAFVSEMLSGFVEYIQNQLDDYSGELW
nr:CP52k-like protein 15 [Membranobalanus longirostrum]